MDFSKSKKDNLISERDKTDSSESFSSESYLGKTIKIKGNLTSEESVIIEGRVNGNIKSADTITIGKYGNTKGKLEADVINIMGRAKGDIISRKNLKIQGTAKFDGNINAENVIIEEGGIFNGNMNMSEKKDR